MTNPRRTRADAHLEHLSPLQRAIALVSGILFVAPFYLVIRPLYFVVAAIARALVPSARLKALIGRPPKEEKLHVKSRRRFQTDFTRTRFGSVSGPAPMIRGPPLFNSAPPILPCGEAAVQDAENSMWYAQLAHELAWVAGPARKLSSHLLPGGDSDSCRTTAGSTSSSDLEHECGSLNSSSTKVEWIPGAWKFPRTTEAISLSADSSDISSAGDSSGGHTSSSGSSWVDPPTPRSGVRLGRGKFGSIRKLGTKLRKRVSLRRPRSASMDGGHKKDASFQPSPLGQQVRRGGRPAPSRASSGSLSASMSLPCVAGAAQSVLGWDRRLG